MGRKIKKLINRLRKEKDEDISELKSAIYKMIYSQDCRITTLNSHLDYMEKYINEKFRINKYLIK